MSVPEIEWPDGKTFAFTVFDDTDFQNLENTPPVYDYLGELGFRTTKSVWPIAGSGTPVVGGATCEDERYTDWTLGLQASQFEIGLHNVTYHTSTREETLRGILRFREIYGHAPRAMANHMGCHEALYWGSLRLTGVNALLYDCATLGRRRNVFEGHLEESRLFWGDICRENVTYVRNFVLPEINTLKVCPFMPYHDPVRPFVNAWYASAEGPCVTSFVRMISEENQDRLESEGGACIMYTHLACGFNENGKTQARFAYLMKRLSKKNGWFVPVSVLLDFLARRNGVHRITHAERSALERSWLVAKLKSRRCS